MSNLETKFQLFYKTGETYGFSGDSSDTGTKDFESAVSRHFKGMEPCPQSGGSICHFNLRKTQGLYKIWEQINLSFEGLAMACVQERDSSVTDHGQDSCGGIDYRTTLRLSTPEHRSNANGFSRINFLAPMSLGQYDSIDSFRIAWLNYMRGTHSSPKKHWQFGSHCKNSFVNLYVNDFDFIHLIEISIQQKTSPQFIDPSSELAALATCQEANMG